jgi:hypothetical protein
MAASKKELALTLGQVLEVLELRVPESVFYWIARPSKNNRVKTGAKAGSLKKDGYIRIQIGENQFYAHRLVWFVTYGKFPDGDIDHLNGDRSDNRIENLRDVSRSVNNQNRAKQERVDDLPTGVSASRSRVRKIIGYRAHWYDIDGKLHKAYFGIKKWHTLEAALVAAITRREIEVDSMMSLGAAYTERHGKELS